MESQFISSLTTCFFSMDRCRQVKVGSLGRVERFSLIVNDGAASDKTLGIAEKGPKLPIVIVSEAKNL